MKNKLQEHFPMIRTRSEIMGQIEDNEYLKTIFDSWTREQEEEFLDFCSGTKGVKMMYDFVSKEILNPEYAPERVDELLSLLLGQEVHIVEVLPNDSTRIADESSLVIMDIVVQLADGSIANLEIQKIGYSFPGERSACYSADLLLRQYKRVRGKRKKKFSYKDIKHVYTIVLFEKSPSAFHQFPDTYLHYFEQKSDTGIEMNLLQKYLFVSLDIFRSIKQNKDRDQIIKIENRLDAWLAFMCMDEPDAVISIIEKYPDFKSMYEEVYNICRNVEEVMNMFSKELRELDRNTVRLMMDEMQEELNEKKRELEEMNQELEQTNQELEQTNQELEQTNQELGQKSQELGQKSQELGQKNQELEQKNQELGQKSQELEQKNQELEQMRSAYQEVLKKLSELEKR